MTQTPTTKVQIILRVVAQEGRPADSTSIVHEFELQSDQDLAIDNSNPDLLGIKKVPRVDPPKGEKGIQGAASKPNEFDKMAAQNPTYYHGG